jgi:glycosyltransferase involved in cell wall biosynthesis
MVEVVLPALNEADALPWVLGRFLPGYHAIVVDNGSEDGSASIAAAHGATVVNETRRGFGAACWAGLCAARADVVCFMDADGSLDPAELPRVAEPVAEGRCDLMLGRRRPEPGSWPIHARAANGALMAYVRHRTRLTLRDLGPMRAGRRAELLALGLEDRRSGWPLEMVLRAQRAGWRIDEAPVRYRRRSGRSKVTGTVGGTCRAVGDMAALLR